MPDSIERVHSLSLARSLALFLALSLSLSLSPSLSLSLSLFLSRSLPGRSRAVDALVGDSIEGVGVERGLRVHTREKRERERLHPRGVISDFSRSNSRRALSAL